MFVLKFFHNEIWYETDNPYYDNKDDIYRYCELVPLTLYGIFTYDDNRPIEIVYKEVKYAQGGKI